MDPYLPDIEPLPYEKFNSRADYPNWIIFVQIYATVLGIWDQIDPDKFEAREAAAKAETLEMPTLESVKQAEIARRKKQAILASSSSNTPSSQLAAEASSAATTIKEPSHSSL
ncbi:hypothetical protein F5Y02DRAFT_402808 [Annulohypoxylon stygium]|nr:hypothetical protein F5Y02DRAFT_402808 [Annulohypoxylon stygium]